MMKMENACCTPEMTNQAGQCQMKIRPFFALQTHVKSVKEKFMTGLMELGGEEIPRGGS